MKRKAFFGTCLACIAGFVASLFGASSVSHGGWSGVEFHEYSTPESGGPWLGWLDRGGECIGFLHEDGSYFVLVDSEDAPQLADL